MTTAASKPPKAIKPLKGIRILSLALNLPGPAALMRCQKMGASCIKLEPPGGDPMSHYNKAAYAQLHDGIEVLAADLKVDSDIWLHALKLDDALKIGAKPRSYYHACPFLGYFDITFQSAIVSRLLQRRQTL